MGGAGWLEEGERRECVTVQGWLGGRGMSPGLLSHTGKSD